MHEAVQEAHQKFLSDLKHQKEKHSQDREQMKDELRQMSNELEELKVLNSKKEQAVGDKEEQVRLAKFVLFFSHSDCPNSLRRGKNKNSRFGS